MKKRILAMLLTVCMVFTMLPMTAMAAWIEDVPLAALPEGDEVHGHTHEVSDRPSGATDAAKLAEVTGDFGGLESAEDGSWDIPVEEYIMDAATVCTGTSGDGGTGAAIDGDSANWWYTDWSLGEGHEKSATQEANRWISVAFSTPKMVSGFRYKPRNNSDANGFVTEYRIEVKATESSAWTEVTSGSWGCYPNPDGGWEVANFTPQEIVAIRLVGKTTKGVQGDNKYMHADEIRVVAAEEEMAGKPSVDRYYISANTSTLDITSGLTASAPSGANRDSGDGPAAHAVDGTTGTYWHSNYSNAGGNASGKTNVIASQNDGTTDKQNYIQLTLSEGTDVAALRYLPRQGGGNNGKIRDYEVRVSAEAEGDSWTTVALGTFEDNTSWQIANFDRVRTVRRIRLYATTSYGGTPNTYMTAAEIHPVGTPHVYTSTVTFKGEGITTTHAGVAGSGAVMNSMSPNPVRTGYTFLGWYDENGVLADESYVINGDVTFTAKWAESNRVHYFTQQSGGAWAFASNPCGQTLSHRVGSGWSWNIKRLSPDFTNYRIWGNAGGFLTMDSQDGAVVAKTNNQSGNNNWTKFERQADGTYLISATVNSTSYYLTTRTTTLGGTNYAIYGTQEEAGKFYIKSDSAGFRIFYVDRSPADAIAEGKDVHYFGIDENGAFTNDTTPREITILTGTNTADGKTPVTALATGTGYHLVCNDRVASAIYGVADKGINNGAWKSARNTVYAEVPTTGALTWANNGYQFNLVASSESAYGNSYKIQSKGDTGYYMTHKIWVDDSGNVCSMLDTNGEELFITPVPGEDKEGVYYIWYATDAEPEPPSQKYATPTDAEKAFMDVTYLSFTHRYWFSSKSEYAVKLYRINDEPSEAVAASSITLDTNGIDSGKGYVIIAPNTTKIGVMHNVNDVTQQCDHQNNSQKRVFHIGTAGHMFVLTREADESWSIRSGANTYLSLEENSATDHQLKFKNEKTAFYITPVNPEANDGTYYIWTATERYYDVTFGGTTKRVRAGQALGSENLPTPDPRDGQTFLGWYTAAGELIHAGTKIMSDVTATAYWANTADLAQGGANYTDGYRDITAAGAYAPSVALNSVWNDSKSYPVVNAIDDDKDTVWCSRLYNDNGEGNSSVVTGQENNFDYVYEDGTPTQNYIQLNLNGAPTVAALRYHPRQDKDGVGSIMKYSVRVSKDTGDEKTWITVDTGTWTYSGTNDLTWRVANFKPVSGVTAVRLYVHTARGNNEPNTTAAEVRAVGPVVDYTVTFNPDNGEATTSQTVRHGQTATLPAEPTKEHYLFQGWFYMVDDVKTALTADTAVTGNIEAVAKWELDTGAILFKYNGNNYFTAADLQKVIEAAAPGDVIAVELLKDIEGTFTVPNDKAVVATGAGSANFTSQAMAFDAQDYSNPTDSTYKVYGGLEKVAAVLNSEDTPHNKNAQRYAWIKLFENVELGSNITLPTYNQSTTGIYAVNTLTINLAGHTIAQEGSDIGWNGWPAVSARNGILTIKSTDGEGNVLSEGKIIGQTVGADIEPDAKLILESGTIASRGDRCESEQDSYGAVVRMYGGELVMTGGTLSGAYATDTMSSTIRFSYRTYADTDSHALTIKGGHVDRLEKVYVSPEGVAKNGFLAVDTAVQNQVNAESTTITYDITGGTFGMDLRNAKDETGKAYLNNNVYTAVETGNVWEVREGVFVAQIGEGDNATKFETLAEALAAAENGETVTLLAGITEDATLNAAGKSITLDAHGQRVEATVFVDAGTLTVTGKGAFDTSERGNVGTADHCFIVNNGGELVIDNGTFVAGCTVVYVGAQGGKATINNGKFAVETDQKWGSTYLLNLKDNAGNGTIIVNGGEFTGFDPSDSSSENPKANFVAAEMAAVKNEETGVWAIVDAAAQLIPLDGTAIKGYATVEKAIAASKPGDTVKLLEQPEGAVEVSDDKAILLAGAEGIDWNQILMKGLDCQAAVRNEYASGTSDNIFVVDTMFLFGGLEACIEGEAKIAGTAVNPSRGAVSFRLLEDATLTKDIKLPQRRSTTTCIDSYTSGTVTLDLAGHTISQTVADNGGANGYAAVRAYAGNLTIKDSSASKTGKILGKCIGADVYAGAVLTLESGTISTESNNNGGWIGSVVRMRGGEFVMNGGTLSTADITGNTMSTIYMLDNVAHKLTITGGRVESAAQQDGKTGFHVIKNTVTNAELFEYAITGGTFDMDLTDAKDALGNYYLDNDVYSATAKDGQWVVEKSQVAEVNGTTYGTLQAAVNAAEDGDTVTLLKDVTNGSGVIVNKNLTIDFNHHSYAIGKTPLAGSGEKYATQAFQLLAGADKKNPNTVIMKNGTIVLPEVPNLQMGIQNYTNLTLSGMTIDASENPNISYVLSNNNGTISITDGTELTAAEGKVAFDVYDSTKSGYGQVSVTVDNAKVTGKIEVSDTENVSLTVTGGEFSTDVNDYCVAGKCWSETTHQVAAHTLTPTAAKEATCTEAGNIAYWTCETCKKTFSDENGMTEVENVTIEALGHSMTKTEAKEATCIVDGNNEYWTCETCEKVFKDADGETETTVEAETIKAGHKLVEVAQTDATFEADGVKAHYACSVCHEKFQDAEGTIEATEEWLKIPALVAKAQIGEDKYESLAAAIDAANAGETVKLLADVTEKITVGADKDLTLDLNGKTVNGPVLGGKNTGSVLVNEGTLVITDNSEEKSGKITRDETGATDHAGHDYIILNKGTLTLAGGEIASQCGRASNPPSTICNGPENGPIATLTITGGKVTHTSGIAMKNDENGILEVTGGEISTDARNFAALQNWKMATITGGTISGVTAAQTLTYNKTTALTLMKDGVDVTGKVTARKYNDAENEPKVEISGGTYSENVSEYCVEGMLAAQNSDGKWVPQDAYATVTAYNQGDVQGNGTKKVTVTFDGHNTLKFTAEPNVDGRTPNKWWAGINVAKPEWAGESAKYQKIGEWWTDDGTATDWTDAKAAQADGQYWGMVTPAYMESLKGDDNQLMYRYRFDWNGDGVYDQEVTVVVTDQIVLDMDGVAAEIAGMPYATLAEAIKAAKDGETVKLLADVAESVTVGKAITLNIPEDVTLTNKPGEHTITVTKTGNLTVTGAGTVDNESNGKAAIVNNGYAKLTGGTFTRSEETGEDANTPGTNSFYTIMNHGEMVIGEGVTVKNDGAYSSMIENGYQSFGTQYDETVNAEEPSLTIEGGTFIGGLNNVKNDDNGVLEITGGTFEDAVQHAVMNWNEATISGGEFTSAKAAVWNNDNAPSDVNAGEIAISGGTYSSNVNDYCAEGHIATPDSTGKFKVEEGAYAAWNVNTKTGYTTLQAAIDAANAGDVVKLRKDVTESVTVGKAITLDLNGNTLTNVAGEHTITVTAEGNLTVEGTGTVDNESHGKAALLNEGKTILNGGAFTRSKENGKNTTNNGGNSYYNIVNHGDMTINSGVTVSQTGHFSSMVENGYQNGAAAGVNQNVKLTINGGDFSGGLNTVKNDDWGTLTITGGTFSNVSQAVVLNWNVATISGGTFTLAEGGKAVILNGGGNDTMDKGQLTITDGDFNGAASVKAMDGVADYLNGVSISGGTFDDDVKALCKNKDAANGYCQNESGKVVQHSLSAEWSHNDDAHWHVCEVCGAKFEAADHTWDEGKVTTEPTCTEKGVKTYTCTVCNATKTEEIAANGHTPAEDWNSDETHHWHDCTEGDAELNKVEHTWDEGKVTTEPTCTEKGVKTYTCTVCHATKTEEVAAKGHNMTKTEAKAATCTEDGNNEYWTCGTCEKVFKDADGETETTVEAETIKAGHKLVEVARVEPDFDVPGTEAHYECSACDKWFVDGEGDTKVEVTEADLIIPKLVAKAQIGEAKYESLAAAINKAETGDVVILLADVTESVTVAAGKEIELNLNGKSVTADKAHAITNNGTLTVTGAGTVDGAAVANAGAIYNAVGATANLNGGTFTGSKWYVVKNLGTMTIDGATVDQKDAGSSGIDNGWYDASSTKGHGNDCGVAHTGDMTASLTIEDGTFTGGMNTVKNDDYGVLTVNGGTHSNTVQHVIMNHNEATITGGTFTAKTGKLAVWNTSAHTDANQGEIAISGGAFSSNVNKYCLNHGEVDGYCQNDAGVVKKHSVDASKWSHDEDNHWNECSACGTKLSVTAHAWGEGEVTTEPTCTEKGVKTYTCDGCGATKTEEIAAKGHTEETIPGKAATCTETGLTDGVKCSVCGEILVEQEVIEKLDHTEVIDAAVEATCTTAGKTEGKHCSVCGEVLVAQEEIPAGHKLVEVDRVAPDFDVPGTEAHYECSVCEKWFVDGEDDTKVEVTDKETLKIPALVAKAQVGTAKYATLEEAVEAAKDGETVKLLADTTESVTVSKTIILDLGGNTLTNKPGEHTITVTAEGNLTVLGGGTVDNTTHKKAALVNYGTAKLSNSTFTRSKENGQSATDNGNNSYYTIDNHGKLNMNGNLTVENSGAYSSAVRNIGVKGDENKGVLNIWGSTISGGINNVKNDDYGKLTIGEGTFTGAAQYAVMNWNEAAISDGTFGKPVWNSVYTENDEVPGKGQLTISGGQFNDATASVVNSEKYGKGSVTITNGTFLTDVNDFCVAGKCWNETTHQVAEHNLTPIAAKAATCTAEGNNAYWTCETCGKFYKDAAGKIETTVAAETIAKLAHTEEVIPGKAATCTETGLTDGVKCSVCDEILVEQEEIVAKGHTEVIDAAVDATCTAAGKTEGKHCSVCGEVLVEQEEIAKLPHTEVIDAAVEATCTTAGKTEGKHCSVCGEVLVEQEVIAKLDHTLMATVAVDATCKDEGNIAYWTCSSCGQKFSDAEATTPVTDVTTPKDPANHVGETEVRDNVAATCTAEGYTGDTYCLDCEEKIAEGKPIAMVAHTPIKVEAKAATCGATGNVEHWTCEVCKKLFSDAECATETTLEDVTTPIDSNNHTFAHDDDSGDFHPATCTQDAYTVYTCTVCHNAKETITNADSAHGLDHHEAVAATCIAAGMKEYWSCKLASCGKLYLDAAGTMETDDVTTPIDSTNHVGEREVRNAVEPTCTATGYTGDTYCLDCEEKIADGETIPMAAHTLTKVEAQAATCTETGNVEHWSCDVCENLFIDEAGKIGTTLAAVTLRIDPANHAFSEDWKSVSDGHYHECARCGETSDFAAHTYTQNVVTAPDCENTGLTTHTCGVCGYHYDEVTAALGHELAHVPGVEATCTTAGNIEYDYCQTCEKYFDMEGEEISAEDTILAALGHSLTHHEAVEATCTAEGSVEYWFCATCEKNFAEATAETELTAEELVVEKVAHEMTEEWVTDETNHWHKCANCDEVADVAAHNENTVTVEGRTRSYSCDVCGYVVRTETIPSGGGGTFTPPTPPEENLVDPNVPLAKPFLFTDVTEADWFYEAVKYVYEKDIMVGINDEGTLFGPGLDTTRASVATMIYRMENKPESEKATFADVLDGMWYTDAVNWTDKSGVMIGFGDGTFGPDILISREQLVTVLYRYAKLLEMDVTTDGDLSAFDDAADVGAWAADAMTWAVGSGIIKGRGTSSLAPQGLTTRGEMATILQRFLEMNEAEAE